ncbi:MAG: TRAP transporter small permease [Rubrivivax sp.]|nr:TRAP transporter small permease [Rubrivivax sp.]
MRRALRTLCGLLAALALFGIMMLTLVDVAGRKVLSTSVPGSLELTELLMVVVIFTSLPLVALAGEHVVFDSFDAWLPSGFKRAQQAFIELLCAAALAALAWLMWTKGSQMTEYGDVTAQLRLPLGVFVHLMSLLIGMAAFAHLLLAWVPVAHHHVGVGDTLMPPPEQGPPR